MIVCVCMCVCVCVCMCDCAGFAILGVVLTIIAVISLPALELFGIQEPLDRLIGNRYRLPAPFKTL